MYEYMVKKTLIVVVNFILLWMWGCIKLINKKTKNFNYYELQKNSSNSKAFKNCLTLILIVEKSEIIP